jgi:hypothetical protein
MFLHHPDGLVTIGGFRCTLEEFLLDEPGYGLPEGTVGRCYQPGVTHWLTDGSGQIEGPLPWPEGEAYLAKESEYRTAQLARTAPPIPTLEECRTAALRNVDREAENRRLAYITPGSGQALVYQEKRREAEAAIAAFEAAAGEPVNPARFPLLAAELDISGLGLNELAQAVLAKAQDWTAAAAAIEGTRLKAKRDIAAAASAEDVDAVVTGLVWGA